MSTKSPITTHILDLGSGHPAAGISVSLFKIQGGNENLLAEGTTNDDGRITDWFDNPVEMGHYRLTFDIGTWYQERGLDTFFPQVSLDFKVSDTEAHYHVPLLLNQWGYSTYRGS